MCETFVDTPSHPNAGARVMDVDAEATMDALLERLKTCDSPVWSGCRVSRCAVYRGQRCGHARERHSAAYGRRIRRRRVGVEVAVCALGCVVHGCQHSRCFALIEVRFGVWAVSIATQFGQQRLGVQFRRVADQDRQGIRRRQPLDPLTNAIAEQRQTFSLLEFARLRDSAPPREHCSPSRSASTGPHRRAE